jgi:serine/threonine-protein kinase
MAILARLEHPGIVRSLASTEVDGELVMVLEYLDGRTLRAQIAEGKLPWQEAARVVSAIAGALVAAHGQSPPIVHRDLKPENIMVTSSGAVKVMDFGVAKAIAALGQTNTQSVGTLQYMSPEQIDAHTIDHRSDLYCLGLVFYELLAGRPPFQSASPRQLLNLQCTAEPPPLPEEVRAALPREVEALLFQLLEKAPEDRPYLAEDVVERLAPFLGASMPAPRVPVVASATPPAPAVPVRQEEAPTPPPEERAAAPKEAPRSRKAREIPAGLAAAIVVVLSVLAGIAAYALRSSAAPAEAPAPASAAAPGHSRDSRDLDRRFPR